MIRTNRQTLFECIRLLMAQVREEQHSRQAMIRALMTEQAVSVAIPTDKEVNERIKELQEVLRKSLTKNTHGGKI